jgi:nucleoside 2-deoxyribosyltransferase
VVGKEEVGPSPIYSDIVLFKSQNRELTKQIVAQIQYADIVIADLTHNNPNVHFELGIALMENKNILRVTGRSLTELGFDIRNLEVFSYKDENHLTKIIIQYMETFFKIKGLEFSEENAPLYFKGSGPIELKANNSSKNIDLQSNYPRNLVIRDGGIRVVFEISNARSPADWFGVYFRAVDPPWRASYLVYVRQSGHLEIAAYPGTRIIKKLSTGQHISGHHELTLEFENNYLEVHLGDFRLETDKLSHQIAGYVWSAAHYADVVVHSEEIVCRDTIEWD